MTHRVCSDIFVSLQTNLFNSPHAFSKKDDFLTKSMSPMVCSRRECTAYCYGFTSWQSFHHGRVHFVCYPLLVDEPVESFYSSFLKQEFWNFVLF